MRHPKAIFIQLTTSCNATCVNCPHPFTYGSKGTHARGVMQDAVWNAIVKDLIEMKYEGQVGLYLHHEPLLDSSLFKKIEQLMTHTKAYVVISTNGMLLNADNRKRLIAARPSLVHVNINSADKTQYEKMMGLPYYIVISNAKNLIRESSGKLNIEINCPVMPGVDTNKLIELFNGTKVNTDMWANSRGGLINDVTAKGKGSRFKIDAHCVQPIQNFNILHDGSVILCCNDWAHESKPDFFNVLNTTIEHIYNCDTMNTIINEFKLNKYDRYEMCRLCAVEMGFINKKVL